MEHKLSELKQIRHITLSDEERAYLRGRIAQSINAPAPSGAPLFQLGMQHGLRIALSSFLFVVFVGGSISAVASNSLPGDPLYSFIINVNEEIKGAFLNTPEEKVAHQKNLVEKRVGEIKTLAESKTLTKEKQAKAQKALDGNIQELSIGLSELSEESPNSALSVTSTLEDNIEADKQAIQEALGDQTTAAATATLGVIDDTLKKVSEQEVKIIAKEIEQISEAIEATSTDIDEEASTAADPLESSETPAIPPVDTPVSP